MQNIVRVLRSFEENGTAYLVMDYCEGGVFSDRVVSTDGGDEAERTVCVMRERCVRELLCALVEVLKQVHDKCLLHRDIKPQNIMF